VNDFIPEHVRAYVYRVLLALLPILVVLGVVTSSTVPLIIVLVEAVLGLGLAVANTSTD
jgi:heme/copper-type cytochrome/quinol oxidase subunit 4